MSYRLLGFSVLVLAGLVVVAARTIIELEQSARAKVGREGQSGPSRGVHDSLVSLPSRPSSPLVAGSPLAAGVTHGPGGPPTAGPVSSHDDTVAAVNRLLDLHGSDR